MCQEFCPRGGVSASVHAGIHTHPLGRHHPGQTPSWADPLAQCMLGYTHPPTPAQCLLGYTHPHPVHAGIHPLPSACWDRHGYCCGRYASYWNAFLFDNEHAQQKLPVGKIPRKFLTLTSTKTLVLICVFVLIIFFLSWRQEKGHFHSSYFSNCNLGDVNERVKLQILWNKPVWPPMISS